MSAPAPPPLPVPLAQLTGPMIVGLCLSWGLFGCATVQVYNYYCFFPKDRKGLKALVYALYIWDFGQTVLFTQAFFKIFGPGFGNFAVLENIGTLWFSVPIMGSISSATVQCFYAWRVYQFGRSLAPTLLIVFLALMECSAALASGLIMGVAVSNGTIGEIQQKTFQTAAVWLTGDLACDIVITLSMIYFLYKARSKTNIAQTSDMLTRIVRVVIGTGLATSLITIVNVTFWFTMTNNDNIDLAPSTVLGKLYVNAFLVTLTSRQVLRSREGTVTDYVWEGSTRDVGSSIPLKDTTSMGGVSTWHTASRPGVEVTIDRISFHDQKGEGKMGQESFMA